jgi:hypothetical protein
VRLVAMKRAEKGPPSDRGSPQNDRGQEALAQARNVVSAGLVIAFVAASFPLFPQTQLQLVEEERQFIQVPTIVGRPGVQLQLGEIAAAFGVDGDDLPDEQAPAAPPVVASAHDSMPITVAGTDLVSLNAAAFAASDVGFRGAA